MGACMELLSDSKTNLREKKKPNNLQSKSGRS